jgi:hypothetical protein
MSLTNEEKVNEEWRSIFEDAAESPSDELWDRIERRLDEEETEPIIPLWPRAKPWVYSVAAAVITLLIGWWATQYIENADTNRPFAGKIVRSSDVTAEKLAKQEKTTSAPSITSANPVATRPKENQKPEPVRKSDEILAANRRIYSGKSISDTPVTRELERSETATTIDRIIKDQSVLTGQRKNNTSERLATRPSLKESSTTQRPNTNRIAENRRQIDSPTPLRPEAVRVAENRRTNQLAKTRPVARTNQPELALKPSRGSELVAKNTTPTNTVTADETDNQIADTRLAYEASYIKNKMTASKNPAPISRIVWYRAPEIAIEPQDKGSSKNEYWAALTATPMSFNPMAAVHSSLNQAYVANNAVQQGSRQAVSPLQNQAQISMAWQASSGVQFSKHWSVEAGVQYLNGRSQVQNNASVTNVFTNQTENLLVNAIRNSNPSLPQLAAAPSNNYANFAPSLADKTGLLNSANLAVVSSDQVVSNNFQYLQVPVQIGYHILPERRISYSVLGGLMANVFLKNTINGSLEINPSDQIYRQMSVAGSAGLRVNYHPTHHWSGSLTGSYQQSLQSGTDSNAQLQVHPQAIGVGFGLNYHF